MNTFATAPRWIARSLSALILVFWVFLLVAHIFGTEGRGSRPLVWQDYFMLATLGVALLGLAVSWKRELTGAVLTIVAIGLCAGVNLNVLLFPGTLIPLCALLFATSALLRRNKSRETAASFNSY
jgi:hypothetical protein